MWDREEKMKNMQVLMWGSLVYFLNLNENFFRCVGNFLGEQYSIMHFFTSSYLKGKEVHIR